MILLLLLNLSISSLFGLPATFGNPPSDPACDALRTVADSLTGARIYGSLCADSMPKTGCTTASLELLKKCLDGIHVDQDCLDRMHTNLTEGSMDDQDCFCGGLVKFSEMLTSVGVLLCLEEDEVRDGMGNFLRYRTTSKPSTTSSSTSTFKKSRSAIGDLELVPYETTNYEKRLYPPAKYVCTTSTYENPKAQGGKSPMEEVTEAEKMFIKLFAYIEGRNNKNQKIEMTAPVFTSMSVEEDNPHMFLVTKTMCFFIPKKLQGNPPAPNDQDVFILEMPEASLFVKTFIYDTNVTDSVWIKEKESFMHEMQVMGVDNKVSKNHFLTATYDIGLSKHEVMLEEITREKKSDDYRTDRVSLRPPPCDEHYGRYGTDMVPPAPGCDPVMFRREDWLPIIDCREDLNLAVTPPDASSVDWRTAKFDPSNYNQLWRQDSEGRIINKANGKVLVMDLYGFRFEGSDSDFQWSFNTYIRSSQEPSGPISQKLQAKSDQDERCLNTANRIDTTGSVLMLYPCETIHPINGCFKFKMTSYFK